MDRFQSETYTTSSDAAARARSVWGDDPLFSVAVQVCENCLQSCDVLTFVEGWNYYGCDTCVAEAMIEAAKDALPAKKPARMQGELFQEVA